MTENPEVDCGYVIGYYAGRVTCRQVIRGDLTTVWEVVLWEFVWFVAGCVVYHTIRQLRLVQHIYTHYVTLNLFQIRPLYAFSWLTDPGYAKNFAGLVQALTVGLPQYGATPTWMFFRNSLLSDLAFTAVFVLLMRAQSPRASAEVAVARAA